MKQINNQSLQQAGQIALDRFAKSMEANLPIIRHDECADCGQAVIFENEAAYHITTRIPCELLASLEALDKGGKNFTVEMPYGRQTAYYYKI